MLLSAVSVLVAAQSSSEIPEGLMNNPVLVKPESSEVPHVTCRLHTATVVSRIIHYSCLPNNCVKKLSLNCSISNASKQTHYFKEIRDVPDLNIKHN